MSISNEKVIDTIKAMPMFKSLLAQAEEHESMKHQRQSDINERLALLEKAPDESRRREAEARKASESIVKCKAAYLAALEAGAAIGRQHLAENYQHETRLGTLENRLRRSAPKLFYDRLEEIENELSGIYNKQTFSAEVDMHRRTSSSEEFQAAKVRAKTLMRERDEINKQIMEEYGYDDEGE